MSPLVFAAVLLANPMAARDSTAQCTITGTAPDADGALALAACAVARERFHELFGLTAPPLEIVLRPQPGYRVSDVGQGARVYWPTSAAIRATLGGAGQAGVGAGQAAVRVAQQWREVLPHEAMHALVAAHFFTSADDLSAPYGTPLPDWFEEGTAIWAEPVASRNTRLAQARRLAPEFQALPAILAGEHPAARNRALLEARDGAALPREDRALWAFYPQSVAALSFVFEAGGAPAVLALAERLRKGAAASAALVGLPGLPADSAAVVAAWERWLPGSGRSGVGSQPD